MDHLYATAPSLALLTSFYGTDLGAMRKGDKLQLILVLLFAVFSAQGGASQCLSVIATNERCVFEHGDRMAKALQALDIELDEPTALLFAIELIQELLKGAFMPDVEPDVVTLFDEQGGHDGST